MVALCGQVNDEIFMPVVPNGGYCAQPGCVMPNPVISQPIINPGCQGGYGYGYGCDNIVRQNAEYASLKEAAQDLQACIQDNDPNAFKECFDNFKQAFKNSYDYRMMCMNGPVDDKTLNGRLMEVYQQINGTDIKKETKEEMSENLVTGFFNGMRFGICAKKSASQLLKENLGKREPEYSQTKRVVGSTAGGAVTGAAIGFVCGGPIGAGVGAVVGAVGGLVSKLWS